MTAVPEGLVEAIEEGDLTGETPRRTLQAALSPLLQANADVLVLGCTHYPLVKPLIQEVAGPGMLVVDSGEGVARQTRRLLEERGWLAAPGHPGALTVFTSGDPDEVGPVVSRLLGAPTPVLSAGEARRGGIETFCTAAAQRAQRT
jgi:glutamate racemase